MRSHSASACVIAGGVWYANETSGSWTLSYIAPRLTPSSFGDGTGLRGGSAPRGSVPNSFSTSGLIAAGSKSPATTRLALFGT